MTMNKALDYNSVGEQICKIFGMGDVKLVIEVNPHNRLDLTVAEYLDSYDVAAIDKQYGTDDEMTDNAFSSCGGYDAMREEAEATGTIFTALLYENIIDGEFDICQEFVNSNLAGLVSEVYEELSCNRPN